MLGYQRDYTTIARNASDLTSLEIRGMTLWATKVAVQHAGSSFRGPVLHRIHTDPQTREVLMTPNPLLLELACSTPPSSLIEAMEALERAYLIPKGNMPKHAVVLSDGRVPCDCCDAAISIYEAEGNYPAWSQMICNTCAASRSTASTR